MDLRRVAEVVARAVRTLRRTPPCLTGPTSSATWWDDAGVAAVRTASAADPRVRRGRPDRPPQALPAARHPNIVRQRGGRVNHAAPTESRSASVYTAAISVHAPSRARGFDEVVHGVPQHPEGCV